jgi:hypothetical protein
MSPAPIELTTTVPATDCLQIVLGRVASRDLTHAKRPRTDKRELHTQNVYRSNFLHLLQSSCREPEDGDKLILKFRNLAENLERTGAVAIPTKHQTYDPTVCNLGDMWQVVIGCDGVYDGKWLPVNCGLTQLVHVFDNLLDPLLIALLAYQMGGPINAANTAHAHQWKPPTKPTSPHDAQNFHMEGEHGDVLHSHRLTLVWEEHGEESRSPSGSHHIFLNGSGLHSQVLKTACLSSNEASTPVAIIYNSKTAALVYDCQKPDTVRNSISLDFQVETTPDDVLELLADPYETEINISSTSLVDLILNFPVRGYSTCFHNHLFSPASLQAIANKLASIEISPAPPFSPLSQHVFLRHPDAYGSRKRSRRPLNINMGHDVCISGPHPSLALFIQSLSLRARRDMHSGLGWDLFPHDIMEENRERARKYLRDMPAILVTKRLELYAQVLVSTTYTAHDLLSTDQLQILSRMIEHRCNEFIGNGYVDPDLVLNSMPPFAAALGKALNGPKEVDQVTRTCVDELSCQYYRTRCMYLFWCADWLANHHDRLAPGPFMLMKISEADRQKSQEEIMSMAKVLLRNWVAWGLILEWFPPQFRITI